MSANTHTPLPSSPTESHIELDALTPGTSPASFAWHSEQRAQKQTMERFNMEEIVFMGVSCGAVLVLSTVAGLITLKVI